MHGLSFGSKNTKKVAYHGRVEHMREVEILAKKKPCVSFFFFFSALRGVVLRTDGNWNV